MEGHDGGHRLLHIGTGGYVSVAADGAKVAVSGEKISREDATVFESETVESGADAVARIAAAADTVIVVAGNDPHINGRETEDRTTLDLPAQQDRLWRAAHAANPRTVLVLSSAYPYAVVDAAAALPALLWTAHGGRAAGTALARVLAGDVSPAGRLPQTWYASDDDLPGLFDYDVIGSRQTYLYFRGAPLFPFGHGLGYTDFTYSGLRAEADGDQLRVSLTVTNDGTTAADEVAQVYVRAAGPAEAPAPEGLGRRLPSSATPRTCRCASWSATADCTWPPARPGASNSPSRCRSWGTGTWRTAGGPSSRAATRSSWARPAPTSASPPRPRWAARRSAPGR